MGFGHRIYRVRDPRFDGSLRRAARLRQVAATVGVFEEEGRNLATLVETAVRVHLLRLRGYNAAERLVERHRGLLRGGAKAEGEGGDSGDGR